MIVCKICLNNLEKSRVQWWSLQEYFGITGIVCEKCYAKVAHDCYGVPKHQVQYDKIIRELSDRTNNMVKK